VELEWTRLNGLGDMWSGVDKTFIPQDAWVNEEAGFYLLRWSNKPMWFICTDISIFPDRCCIGRVYIDECPPFTWANQTITEYLNERKQI
jgi:hypothetical protein